MSLQISDVWIPSHCLPRKSTTSPAELDKIENLYNCKNFNSVEYFFGMTFFASLWAAFFMTIEREFIWNRPASLTRQHCLRLNSRQRYRMMMMLMIVIRRGIKTTIESGTKSTAHIGSRALSESITSSSSLATLSGWENTEKKFDSFAIVHARAYKGDERCFLLCWNSLSLSTTKKKPCTTHKFKVIYYS